MEAQPPEVQPRPTVACLRCREQKLKCGRELPTCERCRKQHAACTYPAPPDRKRIAQNTNRAKASHSNSTKDLHRAVPSSDAETNTAKRRRLSHEATGPFQCLAEPEAADLPSTEIGLLLLEVFHKRIWTASLMFHKTVGFQVYMLNKTPEYLQRAQFAHAAMFLQEVDPQHQKYIKAYPMQTLYERSWSWAHAASVEVLSHVDEPSILKIQALQVLQLYYYARGELVRAKVHESLAYRLSQLLGYDKLYESENPNLLNPSLKFDREIRRRSFWACWSTACLDSEDLYSRHIHETAAGLPLPARFGAGGSIQGVDLTHGQTMSREWRPHKHPHSNTGEGVSLMADMVQLLGIWAKVRALTSKPQTLTFPGREELGQLFEMLRDVEKTVQFPTGELFAKAKSYEESPEFLVCVCSLHCLSSIFAQALRGKTSPVSISRTPLSRPLAECGPELYDMIEQAQRFTELLQHLIANDLDITRLWHVAGFTAFIAARVFLFCHAVQQTNELVVGPLRAPAHDSDEMKTLQTTLEVLSIYWKPLRTLAANLKEAIESSLSQGTGSSAVPQFPWNYINFLCDGEPDPNVAISVESQTSLSHQEPAQEGSLAHIEVPQAIGAGFLPLENSVSNGFGGQVVESEWWRERPYTGR